MLFDVVCCLVFGVCCFGVCSLSLVIDRCVLLAAARFLVVGCLPLVVVRCLLFVVCLLFVFFVACWLLLG